MIEIILALLLLLATIQSTTFFLGRLKVKFLEWFYFNACAPSNIVFLISFVIFITTGNRIFLHCAILPMFFFGFLGMFVFSWKGMNIIPQVGHITMTLNIAITLWQTFSLGDYHSATIGLLVGIVVFSIYIGFQQNYVRSHPEEFKRLMRIEKLKKHNL
jgi:hypothetical protein